MPKKRSYALDQLFPRIPRGKDGLYRCRYCGKPIPSKDNRYRAWCRGGKCVHEALIRARPQSAAAALFGREKGVCRNCGCDTGAIGNGLQMLLCLADGWDSMTRTKVTASEAALWRDVARDSLLALQQAGWNVHGVFSKFPSYGQLWEMDHIREHAEGGDLEPQNLQTLCVPCHKAKTRAYLAAKAGGRRGATGTETLLFDPLRV